MLAHLSRKRLVRGNFRTGEKEYERTALTWSGYHACGDELQAPVCIVIDVGREFSMTFDNKLYLTGKGKGQFQTFTPSALFQAARQGWFGFTLLWDADNDDCPETESGSEGANAVQT